MSENGSATNSPAKSNYPRFDWIQKIDSITVIFYTKAYCNPQVQITTPTIENEVIIYLMYNKNVYENKLVFLNDIHWPCKVIISCETGKVEIVFRKIATKTWDEYGTLEQSCSENSELGEDKIKYVVLNKVEVTHNTCMLSLQRIDGHKQTVPVGYHVRVYGSISGKKLFYIQATVVYRQGIQICICMHLISILIIFFKNKMTSHKIYILHNRKYCSLSMLLARAYDDSSS